MAHATAPRLWKAPQDSQCTQLNNIENLSPKFQILPSGGSSVQVREAIGDTQLLDVACLVQAIAKVLETSVRSPRHLQTVQASF